MALGSKTRCGGRLPASRGPRGSWGKERPSSGPAAAPSQEVAMLTEWRIRMLAQERARVLEHQSDPHGWCAGCLAVGYVEEWPCITVGTAVLAVEQLKIQLTMMRTAGRSSR